MSPREVVERWVAAMSHHDLDGAAACFAPGYRDEAPARAGEVVRGRDEVRANFERLFGDVPDLEATLLDAVEDGDRVWTEWRMTGTRRDGSRMVFAGVNIFTVRGDLITEGTIYTELVRDAGGVSAQLDRMT